MNVYPTEKLMLSCLCGKPLSLAMVLAAQGSDTGVRVGVVMTLRRQE